MVTKTVLLDFWKENFAFSDELLQAFVDVDRARFVPMEFRDAAYQDSPLPITRGKTISQPTTVMLMTAALELKKGDKVFEIGTGSGYQTAIISELVGAKGKVITTEVIPELVQFSRQNLGNYPNVSVHEEDGSQGFKSAAPFDKIIITAACNQFPPKLIEQLKVEGIIVAPVGTKDEQVMTRGIKQENGILSIEFMGSFLFTPLYGKYGFEM